MTDLVVIRRPARGGRAARVAAVTLAAVIGGVICLITVPFTPIGVPILLSVFGVLVGLQKPVDAPNFEVAS